MTFYRKMFATDGTIGTAPAAQTVELTVLGWTADSQTVTATGVTASNIVIVTPTPADQAAYVAAGIICTTQGADSLTFTCDTTPIVAIDVQVVIL